MESLLTLIGSIASIAGALWAFYEAKKASTFANKAEVLRDEMVQRREMVEVTQVHAETTRILKVASKVGPSTNSILLQGVNCADVAKEIEEYSRYINEQSSHFSVFFENKAQELCSDLREDIELLAEARSFKDKKTCGKSIYYKIYNFMPTVKQLSDEKRERPIESNGTRI